MTTRTIFVPGRVELFGKHVDYGGGRSLTCAIEMGITADVEPLDAPVIEIEHPVTGKVSWVPLNRSARTRSSRGSVYIAAVARRIARDFAPIKRGVRLRLHSDLPSSAGLSSSSAFIVLLVIAVVQANGLTRRRLWRDHLMSPLRFAEYCSAVEMGAPFGPFRGERGVGTRGGAQDHVAIVCSEPEMVSSYRYLPAERMGSARFPAHWSLVIATSGVRATKTGAAQADYNNAAAVVQQIMAVWNEGSGRSDEALYDVLHSAGDAADRLEEMLRSQDDGDQLLERLRQFRAESERIVPDALAAFRAADATSLGRLAAESQHLAESVLLNQIPETTFLCQSAMQSGALGASAFGAGFGGAVWAAVETDAVAAVIDRWRNKYAEAFPTRATRSEWFVARPSAGVKLPWL